MAQENFIIGQASGWFLYASRSAQSGMRYIPEFTHRQNITDGIAGEAVIALNAVGSAEYFSSRSPLYIGTVKPYRLFLHGSTDQFEFRLGLQKINFGSAMMFRPLMWFDAIDPRDPLQLTDGVYGALARYFFSDNTNLWLWGLYGNNKEKGLEFSPTDKNSPEFGGRIQTPFLNGEIGATVHRRITDMSSIRPATPLASEYRYALDGKWDVGTGLWLESVLIQRNTSITGLHYQRFVTVGADYTLGIENGITVATEYFHTDSPNSITDTFNGNEFSAFSFQYPVSLFDRLSCIVYRDWKNKEWYRLISFQRTYDDWIIYCLGFWNPPASGSTPQPTSSATKSSFLGKGIQLMVVYHH